MDAQASASTFCPQCGAPAPFRGTTVTLVCEYCESTIVRSGVDVTLLGKVSAIVDTGSPILLGSRGRRRGVPFEVAGRLQVSYDRGTWNEWFVEFADRNTGWLTDAQGQYSLLRPRDRKVTDGRVPTFAQTAINMVMQIDGVVAVVVDRRGAHYQGAEGSLPFDARPGGRFFGVDLRGFKGEFISLDYGPQPDHASPIPYFGDAVDLMELGLQPLRRFSGWPAPERGRSR